MPRGKGRTGGHASVEVELSLEASRLVRIHRQDLQQVLVNLLVNAVHAMEPGPGRIRIMSRDCDDTTLAEQLQAIGAGRDCLS